MAGSFILHSAADRESVERGELIWVCRPANTGAQHLVTIEVTAQPGWFHNFHKHPDQEEILFVIEGTLEQWLEQEKRLLGPGDAIFIPADTVHASFNVSSAPVKFLAILGPAVGQAGYSVVEVGDQEPWHLLRNQA